MIAPEKMNSVEKVVFILKLLSFPPYELSLTELAQALDVSKSSALKILGALARGHVIGRDPSTKKYRLGPVVMRLGIVYSDLTGLAEASRPVLEQITQKTGKTAYVAIWDGDGSFMAVKNENLTGMIFQGQIGRRFPINGGAIGKVIAAYQPQETIDAILADHPLETLGPNTKTDPDELLDEFKKIRDEGVAYSDREYKDGGFGVAAPIHDRRGDVFAGVALVGRRDVTPENVRYWTQVILGGAAAISRGLVRL